MSGEAQRSVIGRLVPSPSQSFALGPSLSLQERGLNARSYATLISGASSAFMPMTL